MKLLVLIALAFAYCPFFVGQTYTSYFTGNPIDSLTIPTGGSCLMGGATESDDAMRWFLQRANGGDILVLRASGSDGYNTYLYSDLGISVNSVETIVCNDATCADESYIQQKIQQAEAIWFAGGDQWDYISYWRNTAIDSLINIAISERNIVIGGTSAGMAILGRNYFSAENGTVTSATALANPFAATMTIDSTAFLHTPFLEEVVTDTHYDSPDRKGRHAAFLARLSTWGIDAKGIACDEYTAVCITPSGIASVYGNYPTDDDNAYFIQRNCLLSNPNPENCSANTPLTWNHNGEALVVYAIKGTTTGANTFDLNDWQTGVGGTWNYWSVNTGVLNETAGNQPDCGALSVNEINATIQLNPNPTTGNFSITSTIPVKTMCIRNTLSEILLVETNPQFISIASLPVGIYLVECETEAGTTIQRIIKE